MSEYVSRFAIADQANTERKVYLVDPGTGEQTEFWLSVRSQWCDEFQRAKRQSMRAAFLSARPSAEESPDADLDQLVSLTAALVADWHLDADIPCTPDNVRRFLRKSPQIRDQIDRYVSADRLFFQDASGAF